MNIFHKLHIKKETKVFKNISKNQFPFKNEMTQNFHYFYLKRGHLKNKQTNKKPSYAIIMMP